MKIKNCFWVLALSIAVETALAQPIPNTQPSVNNLPHIAAKSASCPDTAIEADVVAIDHPMIFNRLGAQNVNWMMYALRHDVIDLKSNRTLDYTEEGKQLFNKAKSNHASRGIALRPDLRPRPLVLRVAAGDYLKVRFTNLLHVDPGPHPKSDDHFSSNQANPFDSFPNPLPGVDHPMEHARKDAAGTQIYRLDDQVASRLVGFHPQGLELARDINDDSSYVGENSNSLVEPGQTREYCFYAAEEGAYLVSSDGAVFGGDGTAGNSGVGLFGAVTVQPSSEQYKTQKNSSLKTRFYRAQVTEEELRLATKGTTPSGQPNIDYEKLYPDDCKNLQKGRAEDGVWCQEGKANKPILKMTQEIKNEQGRPTGGSRIIHGDINALIIGPNNDGSFPEDTYPLESRGYRNPSIPNRLEPFREFVSIFHDENAATQAFPYFFEHPELKHTLHGVRDTFMINYGSGGVGAEIIANRLKVGPMQDCLDCAYEEFFLSAFAVGDAAMLVDNPSNLLTSQCQPEFIALVVDPSDPEKKIFDPRYKTERENLCLLEESKKKIASEAYYPHDPANVNHSYIGDFVKIRNLHSGKEQHIFHLHNHQWLFNPNDDNSNYIDAQGIGPGSGYTYEIAFGGSGNRNKTVGDAIYHCHFYPHFAQGMWYMWRNHDVFEAGTRLAVSGKEKNGFHKFPFDLKSGKPAKGARALPDGEIIAGTPIPAIVPLPGKGMAPMPEKIHVAKKENGMGSKAVLSNPFNQRTKNPGYPFWVAGVTEHDNHQSSIGSRPTTPPLDMSSIPGVISGWDGGLPRHALAGYLAGGDAISKLDRFSAEKFIEIAKPIYFPEEGTGLEQVAMDFHAVRKHPTHMIDMLGKVTPADFITNGSPRIPGAPYNEPCIDDLGNPLMTEGDGHFFGGRKGDYINVKSSLPGGIEFGGDRPRIYKGANLQLDVVFNKLGYHYPQQRILALWEDVGPLLDKTRPPEPLVMRLNTFDCAMYAHTNLVPGYFSGDDYQITTPTDVLGQHIHLPKWDLTSADGSANGWNYEDGTFSPGVVRERITAINKWNDKTKENKEKIVPALDGRTELTPKVHPYFNAKNIPNHQKTKNYCEEGWNAVKGNALDFEIEYGMPGACDWFGARTTLQRWFSDPVVNIGDVHRGLGITFTHDHLGPSTHQQLGLYATMLTEPPGSEWKHNETGEKLYTRKDGGPTSWQAVITGKNGGKLEFDGTDGDDSHREFFLQFGDFQHAYVKGAYYGVDKHGESHVFHKNHPSRPTPESFRKAINPSVRKPADPGSPDIIAFEPTCPGGLTEIENLSEDWAYRKTDFSNPELYVGGKPVRPCAEAISADDIGMMVVNYRNEPIGARVFDPSVKARDGKKGRQADDLAGDLAFAMQTRTDRAIPELNTKLGATLYPPLTSGILDGDPFTPIMRTYSGDQVRVKIQGGAHEHEHNGSINALGWLQAGSGFGKAPHSGWRNSQNTGLSEQFTFYSRITDTYNASNRLYFSDRMYTIDSSQDGLWNGVWGVMRNHMRHSEDDDLFLIHPPIVLGKDYSCPGDAPPRKYNVSAVLANHVLDNPPLGITIPDASAGLLNQNGGTLVYNPRSTQIKIQIFDEETKMIHTIPSNPVSGPLHDPTAIMLVLDDDLDLEKNPPSIKPGKPVEPLVLRAAAGECIKVELTNRLPEDPAKMPDLDGYTSLSGIIIRDEGSSESKMTTFNNNLIRPSNHIGLHPQLVHYAVHDSDGNNIGRNQVSTVAPGGTKIYTWYAGILEVSNLANVCPMNDEDDEDFLRAYFDFHSLAYQFSEELTQLYEEPHDNKKWMKFLTEAIEESEKERGVKFDELKEKHTESGKWKKWHSHKDSKEESGMSMKKIVKSVKELIEDQEQYSNLTPMEQFEEILKRHKKPREESFEEWDATSDDSKKYYADIVSKIKDKTRTRFVKLSSPHSGNHGKGKGCDADIRYVPIEFGGTNLTPPDRIKQGQKGAVGALVIEPEGSTWVENDLVIDRQSLDSPLKMRATRTMADVTYPVIEASGEKGKRIFRDLVMVHQKGLNLRYKDGSAIPNLAAEKENLVLPNDENKNHPDHPMNTAPEDAHDSGHVAINYGAEPMWFRFGLPPDAPFGKEGFGGAASAWQAFSNHCCSNKDAFKILSAPIPFDDYPKGNIGGSVISADQNVGEPYVPIMTAYAGQEMRIRALLPTGVGRASTMELHGHSWSRDPYLAEHVVQTARGSFPLGTSGALWGAPSKCIGENALTMWMGGQESLSPMAHFDMVFPRAGGHHRVEGDFLWRDHGGFGITNGLWALVRVGEAPPGYSDLYEGNFAPSMLRTSCDISG